MYFLNGVLETSASATGISVNNNQFFLGGDPLWCSGTRYMYTGQMDELRLWNTSHTATQIAEDYNKAVKANSTDLIAYYNFNGGSLKDSCGRGNHITFNNAVKTTDRFGRTENAYLFNGASSYMRMPNSTSLNPGVAITLMAIVKMNGFYSGVCHGNQIFQKGTKDQNQGVYSLRVADVSSDCSASVDTSKERAWGFYGDDGASIGVFDVTKYVRTNTWMTLVVTYDGKDAKFYVDGVLKGASTGTAVFTANPFDLFIGRAESPEYPY